MNAIVQFMIEFLVELHEEERLKFDFDDHQRLNVMKVSNYLKFKF